MSLETVGPTGPSSPSPFTFRSAGHADVAAVVELVQSAYRGDGSREGWTTEADWIDGQRTDEREVGSIISDPGARILLAEDAADAGTGLLATCQIATRPAGVAYFGMFAVRPDQQGRGTGRALLREAEQRAAGLWAASTVRMTVLDVRADLIAWYERLGYAPTGETEPFPYGNPAFGVPRVPDLRFTVLTRRLGR